MCIKKFCKNLRSVLCIPLFFLSFNDFRNFPSFRLRKPCWCPFLIQNLTLSQPSNLWIGGPLDPTRLRACIILTPILGENLSSYLAIFEFSRSHEAAAFPHIESRFAINARWRPHRLIRVFHCSDMWLDSCRAFKFSSPQNVQSRYHISFWLSSRPCLPKRHRLYQISLWRIPNHN